MAIAASAGDERDVTAPLRRSTSTSALAATASSKTAGAARRAAAFGSAERFAQASRALPANAELELGIPARARPRANSDDPPDELA